MDYSSYINQVCKLIIVIHLLQFIMQINCNKVNGVTRQKYVLDI